MPKRQPEGIIKDDCRVVAKEHDMLFWQIEGKSRNGIPDTVAERVAGGVMFIEFKVPGREPTDQQWLRIWELRQTGQEAWWCDSVDSYRALVGLAPGGYTVAYPERIKKLIALGTVADKL